MKATFSGCVLLLSLGCASPRAAAPAQMAEALPFIENDYARALVDARARHVPVFVDAWAPW